MNLWSSWWSFVTRFECMICRMMKNVSIKNNMFFMSQTFGQNNHLLDQCEHFQNQIVSFKKSHSKNSGEIFINK
jgi:hypothetical protein